MPSKCTGATRWRSEWAAEQHLRKAGYDDLFHVDSAADLGTAPREYGHPDPTGPDILAALTVTDAARRRVDYAEIGLIGHALARGVGWEEIAAALGYASTAGAAGRYRALRRQNPGHRPPRVNAAQWAAEHERELRDAVNAVTAFQDQANLSQMLTGSGRGEILAKTAAGDDPVALYWVAFDAAKCGVIIGDPDTPAGRAVDALQALVTEPELEPAKRRRRRRT